MLARLALYAAELSGMPSHCVSPLSFWILSYGERRPRLTEQIQGSTRIPVLRLTPRSCPVHKNRLAKTRRLCAFAVKKPEMKTTAPPKLITVEEKEMTDLYHQMEKYRFGFWMLVACIILRLLQ